MRVTRTSLADGRELLYYDNDGAPERVGIDERALEPRPPTSELRYDPLLDVFVMVAAFRQERTYFPAPDDCPLCPTRPGHESEIPASDYGVAVLENRFPALSGDTPSTASLQGGRIDLVRPGTGRCEVVCFSSNHDASFVELGSEQARLVLEVQQHRTAELSRLASVAQVYCFENRGVEIGVTLQHPHGQIYAYPLVTPRTARMLASLRSYRHERGRNLFDDVVEAAQQSDRLVAQNEEWIAFVPFAARWPYEVHCYPTRRVPDLAHLDATASAAFPDFYLDLLGRFEGLFGGKTPYISGWHQAPVREERDSFACHLELFTIRRTADKLKYLAASESGMDAFANDVGPEQAAARLRELGS